MKGYEIRDFCGDYALDIPIDDRSVYTIYFNSYRNAKTVKRIMEVDDSDPNAATVCDMVEVVRCKDCRMRDTEGCPFMCWDCGELIGETNDTDFCSYGERKEQT